jgi:hypothetical protein
MKIQLTINNAIVGTKIYFENLESGWGLNNNNWEIIDTERSSNSGLRITAKMILAKGAEHGFQLGREFYFFLYGTPNDVPIGWYLINENKYNLVVVKSRYIDLDL